MKTQKHSKEIDDFSGLPSWAETFNFYHHSPSGCQRPDGMEFLEKVEARPRKIFSPPNAPMISGTQGENHCKRVVIDGDDNYESYRHALSVLEQHQPAPWDEADKAKHEIILNGEYESVPLEKSGTVFELTLEHLVLGLRESTKGENKVEDGPWISLPMDGLILPFAGEIDVKTRGIVEIKTQWPYVKASSKRGWTLNSLPARPKPEHVAQVAVYHAWMLRQANNVPVQIVYANCKDFRVFSSQDCDELQPARLDDAVERLRLIAATREKLMSKADDAADLFSMVAPDFDHWMWKSKSPEYKALAQQVWNQ